MNNKTEKSTKKSLNGKEIFLLAIAGGVILISLFTKIVSGQNEAIGFPIMILLALLLGFIVRIYLKKTGKYKDIIPDELERRITEKSGSIAGNTVIFSGLIAWAINIYFPFLEKIPTNDAFGIVIIIWSLAYIITQVYYEKHPEKIQ